jgi:hypothetical protein
MPVTWQGKELKTLTDAELQIASGHLNYMHDKAIEQRDNPRYIKKFKNQPAPNMNADFVELKEAVDVELSTRLQNWK